MLGYVTIGTNDLANAAKFYDAIAKEMGAGRRFEMDKFIAWGAPDGAPTIFLTKPANGEKASVGNGMMVALAARDRGEVDRLHKLALSLGGKDEGAPGERAPAFYAAYFRDTEGNKLCAFKMG